MPFDILFSMLLAYYCFTNDVLGHMAPRLGLFVDY